jgi:hypothetical protein
MATSSVPPGGSPGNPGIIDLEPDSYSIWADYGTGGVGLEIADSAGNGFKTLLDPLPALDSP